MRTLFKKSWGWLTRFGRRPIPDSFVGDGERISRYLLQSGHYAVTKGVRKSAFLPRDDGQLSVYRVDGLQENDIWDIGKRFVASPQNKRLHARSDFFASVIREKKLRIVPDARPHPRHANIVDWPNEKQQRMQIALEIADVASLCMNPELEK